MALGLAALAIHWIRREEHPDVASIRNDVTDLTDRVEHWMRRDRTRKLRGEPSDRDTIDDAPPQPTVRDLKSELRRKVFGGDR